MLKQIQDFFGNISKWVFLGMLVFLAILTIILVVFAIQNIAWIILGCAVVLVGAVVAKVLYNKYKVVVPPTTPV